MSRYSSKVGYNINCKHTKRYIIAKRDTPTTAIINSTEIMRRSKNINLHCNFDAELERIQN